MHAICEKLRREVDVSTFLPYTSLVTSEIVKMGDLGTYVFSVEMGGVASECAAADDINRWDTQLHQLTRQIANAAVTLHSHVVQDEVFEFPEGEFKNHFARVYNDKYRDYLAGRKMHATRLFLSVVYRPEGRGDKAPSRFASPSPAVLAEQQAEDIAAVQDLIHAVLAGLDGFRPGLLECYEHNGVMCSRTLELFGRVLNGYWERMPVPRAAIRDILPSVRPLFGKGGLMSRKGATCIEYGAILGIKQYPTPTVPGMLNKLCALPYEWVLSQTFTYSSDHLAKEWIVRQRGRLVNAGDHARSQINGIDQALDALASGKIAMGHHEMGLYISASNVADLDQRIGEAGSVLSSVDIKWLREEIALGSAFFAMLPGNLKYRIAPAMIDNKNFSGLISPHNRPTGRFSGAQWGPAVTVFKSTAGSPIAFNWHQPDPDPNAKLDPSHKEQATALIIGPTGKGKNAVLGHLLTQSQKFATFPESHPGVKKLSSVVLGKDLSMSILVAALDGMEYRVRSGVPSDLAPFQMEKNQTTIAFLDKFVTQLAARPESKPLSLQDRKDLHEAVLGVMGAEKPLRRLRAMLEFFDPSDPDGLHARLAPWCQGGRYAWLFDNDGDALDIDYPVIGFDVTDFLEHRETCTPLMMYLLHRVDSLLDGRRVPIFVDEAPFLMADPLFEEYLGQGLVQIRGRDGFFVLCAQYARQVLNSPLRAALVSQPATMIFLADDKADMNDLVHGFKRTEAEVELIRGLGKREALLCQGSTSVVVDLTLKGFEDELAVLSGKAATAMLCERLIAECGPDPANWMDEFQRRRKSM